MADRKDSQRRFMDAVDMQAVIRGFAMGKMDTLGRPLVSIDKKDELIIHKCIDINSFICINT